MVQLKHLYFFTRLRLLRGLVYVIVLRDASHI